MAGFHRQRRRGRRAPGTGERAGSAPEAVPAATPEDAAVRPEGAGVKPEDAAPSPADVAAVHRSRAVPEPESTTTPAADPDEPPAVREPGTAERDPERGLRGLVGSGSSQVSVGAAARARDAARPTDEDVRAAEELPLVRRNWVPREPFRPSTRRP